MKDIIVTTSWDDGHSLDLKMAELLKKYKLRGTFYVSPKNREFKSSDLLREEQIKSLSVDFEIGAHTMTHPHLSKLSSSESLQEISDSKKYLENIISKPVDSFCYPSGDYNFSHVEQVTMSGFKYARTTKRFYFTLATNPQESNTSLHAYNHWLDIFKILFFVRFNPLKFFYFFRRWDLLAMAMFDKVRNEGGIFHIWGHSWEIDRHRDWEKLEKVFEYISGDEQVSYFSNRELV